jgi:hypothetical protein
MISSHLFASPLDLRSRHPRAFLKRFTTSSIGALCVVLGLTGCVVPLNQRVIHESKGVQIGVEADLSTDDRAAPPILNRHPAQLTTEEIQVLLGSLEVSGWSGIIVGIFETPVPKPVFSGSELMNLSDSFSRAFHEATPRERIFFSLQNPNARYETDRTAGSLFLRDEFLHVILTDHYGFLKADPGGGERRDPRDTKGMKLWVRRPAEAAVVPEDKEPSWSPFEKVHLSLNVRDVLIALEKSAGVPPKPVVTKPTPAPSSPQAGDSAAPISDQNKDKDLRRQVRELEDSNQTLRSQIENQSTELDKLKEELQRLRDDMKASKPSKSPTERKTPRKPPSQ